MSHHYKPSGVTLVTSCSWTLKDAWIHRFVAPVPNTLQVASASLCQGRMPKSQRHAVVVPVPRKSGRNTADMAHFRQVTFLSKLVERVVAHQLHMNIWPPVTCYAVTSERIAVSDVERAVGRRWTAGHAACLLHLTTASLTIQCCCFGYSEVLASTRVLNWQDTASCILWQTVTYFTDAVCSVSFWSVTVLTVYTAELHHVLAKHGLFLYASMLMIARPTCLSQCPMFIPLLIDFRVYDRYWRLARWKPPTPQPE